MKVQSRFLFIISMLVLVAVIGSAIGQLVFLARAEHGTGTVRELRSENVRCGRRNRSKCTKFEATVEVQASTGRKSLLIGSGRVKGHSQPLSKARDRVGDRVPVVFDPNRPEKAYRDEASDIWSLPLGLLIFQIGTLIASFFKRGEREPESEEPVALNLSGPPGQPSSDSYILADRDGRVS